ncbi:hypothetical protein [Achromobacter aloeverae]
MDDDDFDWKAYQQAMKEDRQARHSRWKQDNTAAIAASGIPHRSTNNGETILFRQPGKPKVDFYPSTGRARIDGTAARSFGGARSFLAWYAKQ